MTQQNTQKFNVVANEESAELSTQDDVTCKMLVSILLSSQVLSYSSSGSSLVQVT